MLRETIRVTFCALLLCAGAFSLFGQDLDNVAISGRLTDPNGLAIAGATVTVTETATQATRTATTNDDGRYAFLNLRPGTYKVTAVAPGFGVQERKEFPTLSGERFQVDFKMKLADVRAEATVTTSGDDGPVIDTTRTIVGGTITEREIEEIPNFSRNPLDLVLTLGGTSEEQLSTSGLAEDSNENPRTAPLEQGNFSLSGGVAYSNNITIDGLDNNDDRSSRDRFQPSLESIVEVQVISNQFSAEYGRASGGRINLRTRAGSNRYRGRAFMFYRDSKFNANSWYNNSRGLPRMPLTQYDPGFTFSGPIRLPFYNGRKRTFFSVAYEWDNLLDTTFINTWVPVGSNPRFPLPASNTSCPSGLTCTDGLSSTTTPILPYQVYYDTPNVNHILTARVDHRFSKTNDLTVGYQLGRRRNRRTTGASTTRLDDALQSRNADTDAINFTHNYVFGPKAVNQFRAQWSIFKPSYQTDDPLAPVVLIAYRNPETLSSQTLIAGNSTSSITGDATAFPQNRRERRWQFQDSMTYVWGRNLLKFGGDVQTVNSKALGLGDATGTYNFGNIADFQNNVLNRFRQNFGTRADAKNTYWSLFLNDEIQVASKATLSLGLRYERETAVKDSNNFGPRVGLAWNPFKSGKGVLRFGAGIFYNRVLLRTVADSIQNIGAGRIAFDTTTIGTAATDTRRVAILAAIANAFPTTYPSIDALRQVVIQACATVVNPPAPCNSNTGFSEGNVSSAGNPLRSVEAGLRIPESYQFNVGFERDLGKGFVFETNFTWNKTAHLWRDTNSNEPRLPAGYADWTAYLLANQFVLSPTRRYVFFLGDRSDTSGLHISSPTGATPCTTTTAICYVNLNTTNTSTTTPAVAVTGVNTNATGGPVGIAKAAIAQFRPDPTVQETSLIGSRGNAQYRGLVIELRRRYRQLGKGWGMSGRFVYTLSSTRDDGLNNTANAEVNGDFSREWARSLQDRRHRIGVSGIVQTPWWFGKVRLSPLFRWGSSAPFNIGNGGSDRNLNDSSTDRMVFSGNLKDIKWRRPGSPVPDALISQFSLATIGAISGNLPRNAGRGPSFFTFDLSVTREWKLRERMRLRPVLEVNNILNAAVFNFGAAFIDFNGLTLTDSTARSRFLVPTRTYRQRQMRFGIRFDF
ncbi:MAG: TonB-dependent receptor [Acidobacteria bacterium]|nr:TonB-dependent receptor [Acidobacteriota bacterium]